MGTNQMRAVVKAVYPYKTWNRKVDAMTDAQVVAVYYRMQQRPKEKK